MGLGLDALASLVKVDNRGLESVISNMLGLLTSTMEKLQAAEERENAMSERLASLERESGKSGMADDLTSKFSSQEKRMAQFEKKLVDHDLVLSKVNEKQREQSISQEKTDETVAELAKRMDKADGLILDLEEGQTSVADRLGKVETKVNEQLEETGVKMARLQELIEELKANAEAHATLIHNLQDDVIDKVDVRSLEPLRDCDRALQKQLDEVQERMGRQLGQLEGMVQLKADVSTVEVKARQDEVDAIAEELRKRCQASEAATIQRLRELSNAIAALRMGGGAGGGGGSSEDGDTVAGFRMPVRCISCNRPKSPGTQRAISPARELSGSDGRVYGHMNTAQTPEGARRRPKSAVLRGTVNAERSPGPVGPIPRRTQETVQLEPLSEAQLLARYGIDPNPPNQSANPIRVPGHNGGNNPSGQYYSGAPSPGIRVGKS